MRFSLRTYSVIAALCLCTVAVAQVGQRRSDLAIGASVGWDLNRKNFVPKIKQTYLQSPLIGFAARYICEKYFTCIAGVQAEVNYNNLGWKEVIDDGSDNTYSRHLHYIEVPIMMQMGWGREVRGLKFVFMAGPQFGFLIGDKANPGGSGTWDTSKRPQGVTYQYDHDPDNWFDYGIAAGLGVELSTAIGHFILEGRYYYGLGDAYDNSKKGYFSRSANQTIQAKLTYMIDIIRTKNCIRK
ncbi:MAG: PorT family protein [Bacteroidaceae bacterium]|nr:PorT family protein [Bacteroidaceae bacterium]